MNAIQIRLADVDADCAGIASLVSSVESEPISMAEVEKWFVHAPPGRIARRWVAENGPGRIVGYAVAVHETWRKEGDFVVWVGVLPSFWGRGIGTALYGKLEAFLRTQLVTLCRSEVREVNPQALRFAQDRGYSIETHIFESVLDLRDFDMSRFEDFRPRLEAEGFKFLSMRELPPGRDSLLRAYHLNQEICAEIPGEEEDSAMPFGEWIELVSRASWFRPEGQLLAEFQDRLVGLAAVQLLPEKRGAYNLVTGVVRQFRRRGIAMALKLESVKYARRCGALYLRTDNELRNEGMLAINRKFGYTPEPGKYLLRMEK